MTEKNFSAEYSVDFMCITCHTHTHVHIAMCIIYVTRSVKRGLIAFPNIQV